MSNQHRSTSSRSRSKKKNWQIANFCLLTLFTLLAAFASFMVFTNNVLNVRGFNWLLLLVFALVIVLATFFVLSKKLLKTTAVILTLLSLVLGAFLYITKSTIDATNRMNESSFYSEVKMSVIVQKSSDIEHLSDVHTLEAPLDVDKSNITALLDVIKEKEGTTLSATKVNSYQVAYQLISTDKTRAMVMNSAYIPLLEQEDKSFKDHIKTIYTYTVRRQNKKQVKQHRDDVINVYVSGIDTYGPITTVSRSDVNIIMTINLKTKKILLTTTPRDSYVKIPDGGANQFDKLTHAGIYGVETSEKTLENLYGIDIDYYARINFTSFMNLIDLLGGIEVVNDKAFSSQGYDFPAGKVPLDSKKALAFARERKSLEGGDNDRGRNQQKVITAIINKLTSFKSVTNFSTILSGLSDSIQTNAPTATIMDIANKQIASGGRFTVTSQDVTGTGSTGKLPSYAMPNSQLYMYSLDDNSVAKAKAAIQQVMEGE